MKRFVVVFLAAILIGGWSTIAAANLIMNPSFEMPEVTDVKHWQQFDVIDDWTLMGTIVELQEEPLKGWTAAEGDQWVELDGNAEDFTLLSQGWASVVGTTYEVSFAFSARPGTPTEDNTLYYGGASGPALFQFNATGPLTISADGTGLTTTDWHYYSFQFTAFGNQSSITFLDSSSLVSPEYSNGLGSFLDDITVRVVPEPTTMLLLGFGLIGLAGLRRKV